MITFIATLTGDSSLPSFYVKSACVAKEVFSKTEIVVTKSLHNTISLISWKVPRLKTTESNIYEKYFISAFSLTESSLNLSNFFLNISKSFILEMFMCVS